MLDPWGQRRQPLGAMRLAKDAQPQPDPALYQWLHDIADSFLPAVRKAFLEAVTAVRDQITLKSIVEALEAGNVARAMQMLDIGGKLGPELATDLQTQLEDAFVQTARAAATSPAIPTGGQIAARFDLTNPASLQFLRTYSFGLIQQVTDETRQAVGQIVQRAYDGGGSPRAWASQIKDVIGLTRGQEQALANYRDSLAEIDYPADKIDRMAARYGAKLLRLRAENIARTETLRAANAGQMARWKQAADSQLLNRITTRVQWLVTPDDRLCLFCAAVPLLNPDGQPLDHFFATPLGPVLYPPLHPQCRCTLTLNAG